MSPPEKNMKNIILFSKIYSTKLSSKASFCDTDLTEDLSSASQQLPLNSSSASDL